LAQSVKLKEMHVQKGYTRGDFHKTAHTVKSSFFILLLVQVQLQVNIGSGRRSSSAAAPGSRYDDGGNNNKKQQA